MNIKTLKDIREKSVLIIEPHPHHAETLPGHTKYFADFGYNVDIFITNENAAEYPMCRCPDVARIYSGTLTELESVLQSDLVCQYDFVFFNSITYFCDKYVPTMLHMHKMPKYGLMGVEHDVLSRACDKFPELQKMIDANRLFVLSDVDGVGRMNPHWFGNVKITPKNDKTIFAVVGNIDSSVKNHAIILDAVNQMVSAGLTNFEIVVIGRGNLEMPDSLKKYVRVCGRLNFPDMFAEIENADFLLGLMDINNISHHRYLQGQASGSVQLSYGFAKPLILNDVFAKHYGFGKADSIMYADNELGDAMIAAYKMTADKYKKMQSALLSNAESVYKQSQQSLKKAIANAKKNTQRIPVVFGFDDNYALPASIAIKSLIDNASPNTMYDVIVFYDKLKIKTKETIESIYPIRWVAVDGKLLKGAPTGWSGIATYYRLMLADLLPEYDRVIWSDVDVLFCDDLSEIYNMDMHGADWGGIIAEQQDEKNGVHSHFPENKKEYIYMPGFMIADTKQWRKKGMFNRFLKTIRDFGPRLKMFDLDVLNLTADKIAAVPFEYCVLEQIWNHKNITNAPEYPWLANSHGDKALENAKANPKIIHYAGMPVKIWLRKLTDISGEYLPYMLSSPMFDYAYYYPTLLRRIHSYLLWLIIKIMPIKSVRHKLKNKRKKLVCEVLK